MCDETQEHGAIAVFVVVPSDELHEMVIYHDACLLIEDATCGRADEVATNLWLIAILYYAVHLVLASATDLCAYLVVGGWGAEIDSEVYYADVYSRHAETHACEFAF